MLLTAPQMLEHYRLALLRLVAGLLVVAGIEPGKDVAATVPRRVRTKILAVLLRAEAAARRLIMVEARALVVPKYVPPKPRVKTRAAKTARKTRATRVAQFCLVDPEVFYAEMHPNRKRGGGRKSPVPGTPPKLLFRIFNYDGLPPYEAWSEAVPELSPDDPLNGVPISRRLQALHHALGDLPKQAQRMVREIAKRALAAPGPGRRDPLRLGNPPGHRTRGREEVDMILHECVCLVRREPSPP